MVHWNLIRFSWECSGVNETGRDVGMNNFGDFIDIWGLIDGPLKGAKVTWSSFQHNASLSRLDRFLFCGAWEDLFPDRYQSMLLRTTSDHFPICLGLCRTVGGLSPFKFEEIWFMELDFMDVVSNEWNRVEFLGNPSRKFALKLKALKFRLKGWNKHSGSALKVLMDMCKNRIRALYLIKEDRPFSILEHSERENLKEFMGLAGREEIFWR